jgi:branched-chain amino acid transport system permease protein
MDLPIFALLAQDGVTNGAVYALLALALVLVFAVTRVIFVPSGEFVAYGTLTVAGLQLGKPPATVGLVVGMAVVAGAMEIWPAFVTERQGECLAALRRGPGFRACSPASDGGSRLPSFLSGRKSSLR